MHRRHRPGLRVRLLTFAVLLPVLLAGLLGPASVAQAQTCGISLAATGVAYTQDFNTLASSGTSSVTPAGWTFAESGTNANTTYTAGTGSSNAGDTYSFGSAAVPADRAFGGVQSSSLAPTIGACFTNNTGSTVTSLQIAYTGEQWRLGATGRTDRIDFQYSLNATSLTTGTWTDVDPLDFNGPISSGTVGALDGNAAANRTVISSIIGSLSIASGTTVWIRWSSFDANNADDGLAIDDFSLTPAGGGQTNPTVTGAATPASVAQGGQTLLTATVTPGTNPTSTGLAVTGNLSSIGGSATQQFFDNGTNGDVTSGDNVFSFQATVPAATSAGPKSIPISATDAQSRTATGTIALTVTSTAVTRIHDVQGPQHLSPLVGQGVTNVFGIVTLKRQVGSGVFGFYIQDTPANYDADDRTSEGVLVFTTNDPVSTVQVGDAVLVTGTVTEFRSGGTAPTNGSLATTEIVATAANITVQSSGNTLPLPTVVGTGGRVPPVTVIDDDPGADAELGTFDPTVDGIDFWESLEGMRLQVNNAVATSPRVTFTSSNTQELVVLGDGGANSNSRSARGGVILRCVPSLAGDVSHCDNESSGAQDDGIDFNPERIFLHAPSPDSTDPASSPPTKGLLDLSVNVSDTFPGQIIGVLDYSFGNFKLLVTSVPTKVSGGLQKEVSPLTAASGKLTVGSFNVENIDPGDPPSKFADIAGVIVNHMRSPDILGVEEIQDNDGPGNQMMSTEVAADLTYERLIDAIVKAGGPQYQFRQVDPFDDAEGGEPGGNIRVGFLFNPARVQFTNLTGPGSASTGNTSVINQGGQPRLDSNPGRLQDPDTGSAFYPGGLANAFNASRRPLVGEFVFQGKTVFIVNNHFNSKGGDDSPFMRFQPQRVGSENQRREQARIVREFVTDILDVNPAANVMVLGDLNDFHFSRPVSILETLEGTLPAAQWLHDLLESLPENERYTYVFDGNSQSLDGGILVSNSLFSNTSFEYDVVHVNAEFQDQVSDHEAQVVRFTLGVADTTAPVTTETTVPASPNAQGWFTSDVSVTLTATDEPGGSGVKEIVYTTAVNGGPVSQPTIVPGATTTFSITAEGITTITYFAWDKANNAEASKTLEIKIDKTPPTIGTCTISPTSVWPPNGTWVPVTATVQAQDAGPGGVQVTLTGLTVVEGTVQTTTKDWTLNTPDFQGQILADRAGNGTGQEYRFVYTATDAAGKTATCSLTVEVPHDQGGKKKP